MLLLGDKAIKLVICYIWMSKTQKIWKKTMVVGSLVITRANRPFKLLCLLIKSYAYMCMLIYTFIYTHMWAIQE